MKGPHCCAVVLGFLALGIVSAQTPLTTAFNYQGALQENGAPYDGPPIDLVFNIYYLPVGGGLLDSLSVNDVPVRPGGVFSTPVDFGAPALFDGNELWLEVVVNGTTLSPRMRIGAAPYASYALRSKIGNTLDASDGSPASAVFVDVNGSVGIGTQAPAADLHVRGTAGDATAEFRLGPAQSESNSQVFLSENITGSFATILRHNGVDNRFEIWGVAGGVETGPHVTVRRDSGFVGLGTTGNPVARLHVNGDSIWLSGTDSGSLGSAAGAGLRLLNGAAESNIYSYDYAAGAPRDLVLQGPGGNIGVGLADPISPLHVSGTQTLDGDFTLRESDGTPRGKLENGTADAASWLALYAPDGVTTTVLLSSGHSISQPLPVTSNASLSLKSLDDQSIVYLGGPAGLIPSGEPSHPHLRLYNNDGMRQVLIEGDGTLLLEDSAGNDGVSLSADGANGAAKLDMFAADGVETFELQADEADGASQLKMWDTSGTLTVELDAAQGGGGEGGAALYLRDGAGNDAIRLLTSSLGSAGELSLFDEDQTETIELLGSEGDGQGGQILLRNAAGTTTILIDGDFNGDGRVTTEELEITGGSDLAEQFDVLPDGGKPQPGMVVCIDNGASGMLRLSTRAYDPLVAGVISGAGGLEPGLVMGQRGSIASGAHPVALAGRAYVWCDAAHGPIRPGDLLTTSPTAGHAMRVENRSAAGGAVLGKAMTGLDEGRGLVLVLISLQ